MRYAIIINAVVDNVVFGPENMEWPYDTLCVLLEDDEPCSIGDSYIPGGTPKFNAPPRIHTFSSFEFLMRFTAEERAAIRTESTTDPLLADFVQLAQAAQEIHTDSQMTIDAMGYLVTLSILTTTRKNEIMDTQ